MRVLVLLVLLGGCHSVFNLEYVPSDATFDGAEHDASIDAAPVTCPVMPVVYDEDGDSIDDRCDACPTIASDSNDQDGDLLPNACDPNVATFDKILFYATFAREIDLTAFSSSGITWRPTGEGTISFATEATLRTTLSYQPTRIEVRTSGASAMLVTGVFGVGTTTVMCNVSTSTCDAANASGTCVRLGTIGMADLPTSAAMLRSVALLRTRTPETFCQIKDLSGGDVQATGDVPVGLSKVQITTNDAATAVVQSIVIYGADE